MSAGEALVGLSQQRSMSSISRRGNLQDFAERLNPEGIAMLVDAVLQDLSRRSSSAWAKNALASFKISLALRSSRFSRSSSFTRWASLVVKQDQRSATVRFVPLKQSNVRMASVRLLNAARVQGLAARTRNTLVDRGWRGIAIGDAGAARAQSLVLYPAHRRSTALSLARQFGFKAAQRASGREITVLLGRDAALARRSPAA